MRELVFQYHLLRYRIKQLPTHFLWWLSARLPRFLVYAAAMRMWAYGTCGKYGNTVVGSLTFIEGVRRWEGRDQPESEGE